MDRTKVDAGPASPERPICTAWVKRPMSQKRWCSYAYAVAAVRSGTPSVDVFDVARDGMRADREHLGDLAVGAARDQVHQHFSFARGQHCAWFPLPALRQPERQRAHMLHIGSSA